MILILIKFNIKFKGITKICNSGDLKYYVRENENCIENYKKIVLNKKGKILGTAYRKSSTDNGGSYSLVFEISKAKIQLNYICKDGQSFCEDENSLCHSRKYFLYFKILFKILNVKVFLISFKNFQDHDRLPDSLSVLIMRNINKSLKDWS